MRISFNALWQNWGSERTARQFVQDEMEMLLEAEKLGFDLVMIPEHHFDQEYSACPDNFLPLTYVAARTERIQLALGAVIIPWNNPLRVVEKYSMLDHLSNGRCLVGFGRGLAKMEYERFGIDMNKSREMFAEGYEMIMNGLRTGVVEGEGPFFVQPRTEVVPTPRPSLADMCFIVGMSPDSAVNAGALGGELLMFMSKSIEDTFPLIKGYYDKYTETWGGTAPAPTTTDFAFCHEDPQEAARLGTLYAGHYFQSVVRHYSFDGTHFKETKGYEAYAESAEAIRDSGVDAAAMAYADAQAAIGTPQQIIEKYRHRMEVMGPLNAATAFFYGGMSKAMATRSARLFATEVMPELRKLFDEFVQKRTTTVAAS